MEKISVTDFAELLELKVLNKGGEYVEIKTYNVNRPGMQLCGFWKHFVVERIQILGEMEYSYLIEIGAKKRAEILDKLFSHAVPCVILSTNLEPFPEMIESARKYARTVFQSPLNTSQITNEVVGYLNEVLAPMETRHGVLMDLYGVGVLLVGHSGIGKSETALELIQRGHRLVADDAVVIRRVNDRLIGSSPEVIRYLMEVRGIGIIDVKQMYGVGAVKLTKVIDMVVNLEMWDDQKDYDRLGTAQETVKILDMTLPQLTIPVKPGRNTAVILEVSARHHRLKSMGFNATDELNTRLMKGGDN
ncbi:MAG: HPr(Ser) kinase/phosphatase [Firmicutes bacterium]|nr:HPr(Ser) kinase/phosphatase [Bacillota bacterium]